MDNLEHQVARLEAINSITNLKHRHMYLADSGFPEIELADLWHKDGTWMGVYLDTDDPKDHGKLPHHTRYHGIPELRKFWKLNQTLYTWCLHLAVCPIIDVSDDLQSAKAQWIFFMPGLREIGGKTTSMWVGGTQDDEYRVEDGQWKLYKVRINLKIAATHDQGWAESRYVDEPPLPV